ncbi:aminotransferase class V-fold PLP-dependent enzyme [Pseudidiomarina taiwanensis]|uniref:Cysteine desulfurase CsdA n=1 Tax=Pseudidiomarina taiwanensis TaxID=337250 RepID=A0A432ZP05_9GAMM|nr:aminotransferase class V-fold PLP-dependent enzyme [Pseudidiomarina taiwanensis]RUO79588.1 cysteine desulfurase CsdA [Pseudidiomarina taiwanensis]
MSQLTDRAGQFPWCRAHPTATYLDSAASCQVPESVLVRLNHYYQSQHANVHRSNHRLGRQATSLLECARRRLAQFAGVDAENLSLQVSTTQVLNDLAWSLPIDWQAGDEILLSMAEHHANLLPWQALAQHYQLKLRFIPIVPDTGELGAWEDLLGPRTKVVSVTAASNVSGTIFNLHELLHAAHQQGAVSIIDAAQYAAHKPLAPLCQVADAVVWSAHKMYGVAGAAALAVKPRLWQQLPPWRRGGGIVTRVTCEHADYLETIEKFEAGTPNTAAVVAFAEACDWLSQQPQLESELQQLRHELATALAQCTDIAVLPSGQLHTPTLSFYHRHIHSADLAAWLDQHGFYVRAGHHCAQPLLTSLAVPAVVRVSLGAYNTRAQIEAFIACLDQATQLFA